MNLIAMIGVVDVIKKDKDYTSISLKVEKPFMEVNDPINDYYDSFTIELNNEIFKSDIRLLESGSLIGLKGRIKPIDNSSLKLIAEKVQIF